MCTIENIAATENDDFEVIVALPTWFAVADMLST